MNLIFDTHAHYDDEAFDADREALLSSMPENGVGLIVDPGCDLDTSRRAVEIAEQYPHVYAAVGWHPENCAPYTRESLDTLRAWAKNPKVVAIGEIGLDYYWEQNPPREFQQEVFRDQLAQVRGVFHCFSGSVEIAQELIKRGWYLGFDGPLTYKNAKKTVQVAKIVPLDRVLLETDSPYMAPVPVRGTRNDSRNVSHIAAKFAEIRGMSTDEIIALTNENGRRFFGIQSAKEERS